MRKPWLGNSKNRMSGGLQSAHRARRSTHPAPAGQKRATTPVRPVQADPLRRLRTLPRKSVSVIIPTRGPEATLSRTIRALHPWMALREIIVIVNGCTDNCAKTARRLGCRVIEYEDALGQDTGRALGARKARGEYLLFIDGDIAWTIADVRPFIRTLVNGADIALNAYPRKTSRYYHHPTAIAKRALNLALDHGNLGAASMTAVPHAIRRSVVQSIGWQTLSIPPVAQTEALLRSFKVAEAHYINVRLRNPKKREDTSYSVRDMIIGDHLQAFATLIESRGERGGFSDTTRRRDVIATWESNPEVFSPNDVTVIIPARNEAKSLPTVLDEVKKAQFDTIYVIDNGSHDDTRQIAEQHGARTAHFEYPLGHDVGRAIGARTGAVRGAVFLDSDFPIPARLLKPFRTAIASPDGLDIALNDITGGLPPLRQRDAVSTFKAFLNIAVGRPDLGVNSMTAVPHAMSRQALQSIPPEDLAVPPKAQVRAILQNLQVGSVAFVDVIQKNRIRRHLHSPRYGSPLRRLIVGDHIEALAHLLGQRGIRGGFVQPRQLQYLEGEPAKAETKGEVSS